MKQLDTLKKYILKIQNRLFSLLGTDLYLANKNNLLSSDSIERTNLFDNHQHYRYVKIIWNKSFSVKSLSCEEIKDNNRLIINAFVDFSMVLIIRSLLELKFSNKEKNSSDIYEMSHKQYLFNISLTKSDQSIIDVNINNKTIKFIPLLGEVYLENIDLNDDEYVITPFEVSTSYRSIEITPDDINSEERITKILFKTIFTEYVASYLYPIDSQLISQFTILKEWLKQSDIVVNNRKQGKLDLYVKKYINDQEYKAFVIKVKEQKNNLPYHQIRNKQRQDLDNILHILQDSKKHFDKFFTCLGCGTWDKRRLISISDGFIYKCTNSGCEVTYGSRNANIFYRVKNIQTINGDLEDKIGYENITSN
jgi:hypothetical protein